MEVTEVMGSNWLEAVEMELPMNATPKFAEAFKQDRCEPGTAKPGNSALLCQMEELKATNRWLSDEVERLERLAYLDELTGLANRRRFNDIVASELSRAARTGQPLTLLIFDVDNFKECNDTHGHQAGDMLLVKISGVSQRSCRRAGDLAIRYAGDEFALVLPDVSRFAARGIAERARLEVRSLSRWHPMVPPDQRASVSIGGATFRSRDRWTPCKLAGLADEALYRAKGAGRNRVAFASS